MLALDTSAPVSAVADNLPSSFSLPLQSAAIPRDGLLLDLQNNTRDLTASFSAGHSGRGTILSVGRNGPESRCTRIELIKRY
jgi:hypothetical protein